MTCFHPETIWVKNNLPIDYQEKTEKQQHQIKKVWFKPYPNTYEIEIPCGRCLGCRLDHADMWATRISMEAKGWQKNCFVTLTYNNNNLPKNKTLVKKDIQDFLKRLRYYEKGYEPWENPKNSKKENPIRYFACGEYGPKEGRPHYHMALFNYMPNDLKLYKQNHNGDNLYMSQDLQKIWGKGFVIIGMLSPESASYIARYVQKKAGIAPKTRIYKYNDKNQTKTIRKRKTEREQEFIIMSTGVGLGRKYWEENKEFIKKYQYISIKIKNKVKQKSIPRYFKKLWIKEDWKDYEFKKYENIKKAIEKRNEILKTEKWDKSFNNETKWKLHLEKQERILTAKATALKRDNII